jgi:hypothetical protein
LKRPGPGVVRTRWVWTWAMTICAGPGQREVAWAHPDSRRPPLPSPTFYPFGQTRPIVSRRAAANGPESAAGSESNEGPSRRMAPTAMQDAADGTGCQGRLSRPAWESQERVGDTLAYHAAGRDELSLARDPWELYRTRANDGPTGPRLWPSARGSETTRG